MDEFITINDIKFVVNTGTGKITRQNCTSLPALCNSHMQYIISGKPPSRYRSCLIRKRGRQLRNSKIYHSRLCWTFLQAVQLLCHVSAPFLLAVRSTLRTCGCDFEVRFIKTGYLHLKAGKQARKARYPTPST